MSIENVPVPFSYPARVRAIEAGIEAVKGLASKVAHRQ
jgi:hypothetical protein